MASDDALLEVSGLSVRYGSVIGVRRMDLAVGQGSIVTLLGANGAGKSSTVRAIAGVVKRSGTIRWQGRDISRWPAHRIARHGLVMVPEGRHVFAALSVEENLLLGAYTQRSRRWQRETMDQIYTMFPILRERRTGLAGLLSGGEQQMLAFGRALMANPKMIMIDEPSLGLAPAVVDSVMNSIAEMSRQGVSILMVEQNARAALRIAARGIVMERGQASLTGTAQELRNHPEVIRAFLGSKASG